MKIIFCIFMILFLLLALCSAVEALFNNNDKANKMGNIYTILLVVTIILAYAYERLQNSTNLCEYKLHLYYLSGLEETVTIESTCTPYAEWQRNSYILYYKRGFISHKIHGVVTYKVISKKEIKKLTFKEKREQ